MVRIKFLLTLAVLIGFIFPASAQQIFKAKWQGIGVQGFSSSQPINAFTVYESGGYVYLKAHGGANSGDIIRTNWQGTAVQAFSPGSNITGFETSGPDLQGYVTLTAVASNSQRGDILKTKWEGTAVQNYSVPSGKVVTGFTVSGPDGQGYVTLSAVSDGPGIGEKFDQNRGMPLVFALNPITPNPCFGHTQISYSIAKSSKVSLRVYDCSGGLVKKLVDIGQNPGRYNLSWLGVDDSGRKVGAGVYFVKLVACEFKAVRKIVLVKR